MRRVWIASALLAALLMTGADRPREPRLLRDVLPPPHPSQFASGNFFAQTPSDTVARDAWLRQKVLAGELRLLAQESSLGGLRHERFQQYYQGYPVFGGQVLRHWKDDRLAWVNGQFFEIIRLPVVLPSVSEAQALAAVERDLPVARGSLRVGVPGRGTVIVPREPRVTLIVLPWPLDDPQRFYLAYQVDVVTEGFRAYRYFVDAATGEVIGRLDRTYTQTGEIGAGHGQWYPLKLPIVSFGGGFALADVWRPSKGTLGGPYAIVTFNDRNECCPNDACLRDDHVGLSPTREWSDPAEADAHARAGWVDDFYFRVFRRNGIDGRWIPAVQIVHFCEDFLNAFFTDEFFPNLGLMVYGDGVPSYTYPFTAGFDVIAHEFTHGVTAATSNLVYFRESGALNEAFSDVMAVTAEFFFEPEGQGFGQADWLIGEDLFKAPWPFCPGTRALRSFVDPEGGGCGYQPSHYANRYLGSEDNGGVHINSGIINHAFYLLAVGGRHRLSGISVPAIGRDKAAAVFYVGFTQCLTPTSVFRDARYCTAQAARQLYGPSEESAVHVAFDAVGVPR
ncbi:Thermolysin [bacterium HR11]|nr:Thermolysin [bacterium HR11]